MRGLLAVTALFAGGALALAGCGTEFPLPTESRIGRGYSSDKSYQMMATWTGMDGVADILLTQGPGSQLFLLFNRPGAGMAPRGEVHAYALKARPPVPAPLPGIEFRSLFVPVALCASKDRVFVLDEGDSCLARLNPVTGRCDTTGGEWSNSITDLSAYWRVREYGLLGGDTISTFTDTSMAFVRGVAADAQGRVYVSGSAIVWIPNEQDRGTTRAFQFRINRYVQVTPGSVPPDGYMPGTRRWIRDRSFVVEEGSGLGTVSDPRGLYWSGGGSGPDGAWAPGLLVADFGKNWVQKLSDAVSNEALFKIDADSTSVLNGPTDVADDLAGFTYLADTGNRRVLRCDQNGNFVQRVDVEPDADGQRLLEPVAVAADDSLVYVADRAANKVIRYQRRK